MFRTSFFQRFVRTEAAGGAVLLACAAIALVIANSPWAAAYHHFWQIPVSIGVGGHALTLTIHQWINDGLMAIFFLVVGLEIKREAVAGELASTRQAVLPVAAAIGGIAVPAAIYLLVTGGGEAAKGWAIPIATDIAFALGTLALVAPHAPTGMKVFLTALAIVDDIGAVLVIALFYTGAIASGPLAMAGLVLLILIGMSALKVHRLTPYLLAGAALWFFTHESGIHATIAGVALAFTIPTRTKIDAPEFSGAARQLIDDFDRTETGDFLVLTSKGQQEALTGLAHLSESVTAPLLRLEHALHQASAWFVMPLFALSNAGVTLHGSAGYGVSLAVVLGLVIGKPLGIAGAAFAAIRSGAAAEPQQVTRRAFIGCACVGGIGFTMSLFIANLAFEGTRYLDAAKIGVLAGSAVAGAIGAMLLKRSRDGALHVAEPRRAGPTPPAGRDG